MVFIYELVVTKIACCIMLPKPMTTKVGQESERRRDQDGECGCSFHHSTPTYLFGRLWDRGEETQFKMTPQIRLLKH